MATTTTPAAPNASLYKKMAAVLGEVGRIPKAGENAFFHYRYATESDLMDVLRPLMAKHGLALIVDVEDVQVRDGGQRGAITRVSLNLRFGDGDTGEYITSRWVGEAQDMSDKGIYKAYTGAVKYGLMKTFMVSAGDDPENDEVKPEGAPAPRQQTAPRPAAPAPKPATNPASTTARPAKQPQNTADKPAAAPQDTNPAFADKPIACGLDEQCAGDGLIHDHIKPGGEVMRAAEIEKRSTAAFGIALCVKCSAAEKKRRATLDTERKSAEAEARVMNQPEIPF